MAAIKKTKITILCENVVSNLRGIGEHGFSAYIETEKGSYLFDTGSGLGILYNARIFGKDLHATKQVFLSHGHYDHTGGLARVLEVNHRLDVYAHPAVFDEKFKVTKEQGRIDKEYIGIPYTRSFLERQGATFQLRKTFQEVAHGIFLTGEIPRSTDFERGDTRLFVKKGGRFLPDTLLDDQALIINTRKGLVVVLGCAHAGTINTLQYIAKRMGNSHFLAVIGGTHLGFLEETQLERSIEILHEMDIKFLGFSHCTGVMVAQRLAHEFKGNCVYAAVGTTFEF